MERRQLFVGDEVMVNRVIGGINSEDVELLTEIQVVDTAMPMPLNDDANHQMITVRGFCYMLSSHDIGLL